MLSLSRNFGHQMAITAGLDRANGDAVVVMDADLQDPPEVVSQMIARWREGFDVVFGVRSRRHGETVFKRLTAAVYYRLLRAMLGGASIPVDAGDFRLMSRPVVLTLRALREQHRFVRGLVSWVGFRQTAVALRTAGALRGRDEVAVAQDAALRGRRHHVVLDGAAAHGDLAGPAGRAGRDGRRRLGAVLEVLRRRRSRLDDDHDPGRPGIVRAAPDDRASSANTWAASTKR